MRYEDASNSFQGSGPNANDDSDQLPAGAKEAATGNLITGEGTQYGAAGADSAAGGHVTSIAGKGGEDSSFAGGKLSVAGEFGKLSVDAEGNYNYMANKGAPENVRDRFTYTLADNQGNSDTAALIIELGKTPVAIKTDAQQIVPGPDGVVTLPPGVELSDVMVVGRNLVINMPDGTQLVIVDGAVFVPQLVLDGVQVPATNVAALLIGQEPQPAAGELPPSSGGNFALPPPPLDPGVPLGDLIPPTVRDYIPPEPQEVFDILDEEPEVTIQPVDQAPSVNAVDSVDERGLPTRNGGEPEGTGEGGDGNPSNNSDPSEATSGTIIIDSPDGVESVTIAGADGVPQEIVVGLVVQGEFGTLTITGIVGDDYTYSYVLNDNTSGDDTQDDFTVVLTDDDGDTATATLTIDIIDDVPTARNDVDSVTEGGPEVADGNVLTGSGGADANSTDGVADTVGADDADLTGFRQGNTNGTLGAPFAAQHGTLVLNADGSYTYTLDGDDPVVRALGDGETLTEVFTYTLTDGDGDVSTATLTITIVGTNEAPTIRSDAAVVSEEGLEGVGLPDDTGSDDTTDAATDSGTMVVSDPDGDPVTVSLTTTGLAALGLESNGVPIVWALSDGGHTLTGTAGGDPIITITIDDDGNWEVELTGPVDHEDTSVEDDLSFNVQVTVDDGSETGSGTLTVTIEDDSPVVTAGEVEPTLVADESDFTVNDTKNFGDVFNVQFGGDGGAPDQVTYALGTPGGDSGLVDTLTNEAVVLTLEGGEVVGRTEFGGDIVFVVSVDADGNVTVDQQRAVVHADPTDHDDAISLSDDNLITLTATATDNDGDSDSATINIGNNVVLEDDGPSIDRNQNAAPDLVTDDTNTPGDSDSASFASLFTGAFGNDGFKDSDDNDVEDADAIAYSLSLKDGDGTDSGLFDVATGDRILLRVDGDSIEGYLEGDDTVVAFTLTLDPDTGVVTQVQDRAITHDDPNDPVEADGSAATMDSDVVVITATITDGDGDTAQATADIGDSFHFEDDGPSISPSQEEPSLTVDETLLLVDDSADFSGAFTSSFGKDGPKDVDDNDIPDADAIDYQLGISASGVASGLIDTLSGDPILLFMSLDGTFVEGRVGGALGAVAFTVTVSSSGVVTLDQQRAVVHDDPNDPDEALSPAQLSADNLITLTATITDGDGDTDSAMIGIGRNLNFEDDGPSISRNQESAPVLVTDDTDTPNSQDGPESFAGLFTGVFGNDGFKDSDDNDVEDADAIAFSLSLKNGDGTDSGLVDVLTGDPILLFVDGNTIEGRVGGEGGAVAFTITLNAATGQISLDQDRAITHDDPTDPLETGADAETMAADLIILTATITDGDGDTETATADIGDSFRFEDDGPSAVDDTDTVGAPLTSATGNVITDAEGDGGADDVGADTPGTVVGVAVGDTNAILNNPGTVGVQIQGLYGKLTLNADGSYTYTRDLGTPGGVDDVFTYTLSDADGDKVTATLTITLGNAIPVAGSTTASVDDDGLGGANAAGANDINANTFPPIDDLDGPGSSEASFRGNLPVTGGDGDIDFSLVAPGAGITVGQETVTISGTGALLTATITASPDNTRIGDPLFTVSLNQETGEYIVTLVDNILHVNDASDDEDGSDLSVNIPFQVVDLDGDPSVGNGTLTIVFNDDVPNAVAELNADAAVELDESLPSTASTITLVGVVKGDDPGHPNTDGIAIGRAVSTEAVVNLSAASTYGADGPAADPDDAVYTLNVDNAASGLTTTEGNAITLVSQQNGTVIVGVVQGGTFNGQAAFAIQINPATGAITVEQYLSLSHPDDTDPNDPLGMTAGHVSAIVTIEDADGDTDASNAVDISGLITFLDDGPVITDVTDPLEIENEGPTPTGTGDFEFDVGADDNADNDDISVSNFGITINGDPAQNVVLFADQDGAGNPAPETAANAFYRFTFQYDTGLGGLANGTGTLVFNKTTGEYTVTITSGPISGFSIADLNSIDAGDFVGHDAPGQGGGSDEIVVAPFAEDLFVQFTGQARLTNANEADEFLQTEDFEEINPPPGAEAPADPNNVWVAGDLFAQPTDVADLPSVTVSSADAGVNGNTIQTGEVIDFNLYETDPGATLGLAPTASASDMFIVFDNFDAGDDLIVILKLMDPDTGVFTTKAVVVNQGDYYMLPDAALLDGTVYEAIVSDPSFGNNDSLLVIESNDYNTAPGENWVIVGAQVTNNPDGVSGTGINLDRDLGEGGASVGTESFATDTDVSNLKISNIGFIRPSTTDQQATIEFDVTVTDGDGDSVTQTDVTVNVGGAAAPLLPLNTLMDSTSQEEQLQKTAANSNTLTLATAVAAAGLVEPVAAHGNGNHNGHGQNSDLASFAAPEVVERYSVSDDGGDAAVSMLAPEASSEASAPADSSSSSSSDDASSSNSLDDSSAQAAPESNDAPAADDGGSHSSADAANPVAPTVAMVSAEALQAAANENGNAQQGGSVEQIVAEALQDSGADVDAVLANLPGGNGALQAIAHMASLEDAGVSAWHTGSHAAGGAALDMMMKMDVSAAHHDAVQPVQNG